MVKTNILNKKTNMKHGISVHKGKILAFFGLLLIGLSVMALKTQAQSAPQSGMCVVRDSYTSLPKLTDSDVGKGYAKITKQGTSYDSVKTACTREDFDKLEQDYCAQNTNPVQEGVAFNGTSGCGSFGCNPVKCPPVQNGMCVVRDNHTSLPSLTDPDVEKGYAKIIKQGTSYDSVKTACTRADFDRLEQAYCEKNTDPVQEGVAFNGTSGCGAFGCDYVKCPTPPTPPTTPPTPPETTITPDETDQTPVALTGAKCRAYLKKVKADLTVSEKSVRAVKQKMVKVPDNYADLDNVNSALSDAGDAIAGIKDLLRGKECSEDTQVSIIEQQTNIGDAIGELAAYKDDFQYFAPYGLCKTNLTKRAQKLDKLINKERNEDKQSLLQEVASELEQQLSEFYERVGNGELSDVVSECKDYTSAYDSDLSYLIRTGTRQEE